MSSAETVTDVVGQTIEEIKQGIDALADSTKQPIEAAALELQEAAQRAIDQVKDAVASAFDCLNRCGSTDQLRGYANEAMGKTKLAIARAAQNPELAVAGIAQQAIGELQKFVGEAKNTGKAMTEAQEKGEDTWHDRCRFLAVRPALRILPSAA